jgi:hypothetical protein
MREKLFLQIYSEELENVQTFFSAPGSCGGFLLTLIVLSIKQYENEFLPYRVAGSDDESCGAESLSRGE